MFLYYQLYLVLFVYSFNKTAEFIFLFQVSNKQIVQSDWHLHMNSIFAQAITNFADSYTNCLLFVHYLSLVLLELRHLQTMYVIEVIRSTDGQRRFYNVGDLRYLLLLTFNFFRI